MKERAFEKVGVYVDVANVAMNGGYGMRFDILRDFASRDFASPLRLNAYVAFDETRSKIDKEYRVKSSDFHSILRDFGYKVIEKKVMWYTDETGTKFGKANADLDMAVDALLQSENLDRVILVTGDGDFLQVVRALQNKGCRVEVVAFTNVSTLLKREADMYMSGYLIPNLLPVQDSKSNWGETGSKVRGFCYAYYPNKNFGFMRFLCRIGPGMWITDTRRDDSPFKTAFAHESQFPEEMDLTQLPSRDYIFEFEIGNGEKGLLANNIRIVPTS